MQTPSVTVASFVPNQQMLYVQHVLGTAVKHVCLVHSLTHRGSGEDCEGEGAGVGRQVSSPFTLLAIPGRRDLTTALTNYSEGTKAEPGKLTSVR